MFAQYMLISEYVNRMCQQTADRSLTHGLVADQMSAMTDDTVEPNRGFDFWVGEWDVHRTDSDVLVGRNVITRMHDGHVLAESYTTDAGFTGGSLNGFDHERGGWHQCWMDCTGLVLDLYGSVVDGEMVMTGEVRTGQIEKISWTPAADGTVRQHWQQSTDQGTTWVTVFDGTYKPRASPAESA